MNHFIIRKNNVDIDRRQQLKYYSWKNKNHPTEEENLLWQEIRDNKLGWEFEQQYPVYELDYIVDFVCLDKNLVIEVDGKIHYSKYNKERDPIRTRDLEDYGYKVIRFTNALVKTNMVLVLSIIKKKLNYIW
ncbi:MAG: endonuclease domain-containing protein [bacterium]